ncbi:Nrap protein [Irpex rosettiformis]|uniref:Nrap protein n=1 Tax=Irpex rosettiformis TaxID=378272 RepID=A0ACB8TSF4_9APHY|nr:Nrap protein [Irpex rosettiformis]
MPIDRKRKRGDQPQISTERKHAVHSIEDEPAGSSQDEANATWDSDQELANDSDTSLDDEGDEEHAWGGLNGVTTKSVGQHGTVPKKPPTGEELRTIKDATDLYLSSSFKLKIDALLPKVRPKYDRFSPLEKSLHSLHSLLTSLSDVPPRSPIDASGELLRRGIAVPYPTPEPPEDTKWKVAFAKPQDISLVGGWNTKLLVKRKDGLPYVIDLAVEMPDSLFQEKDYLNNRFFHKKAFYLATIAAALLPLANSKEQASKKKGIRQTPKKDSPLLNVELSWETAGTDLRSTALIIKHKPDGSLHDFSSLNVQIRVIAVISPSSPISLHRLSPDRSNIRSAHPSTTKDGESATPIYNSILLQHTIARSHLLRMYNLQKNVPAFGDALALLKVWVNQRGYGESAVSDENVGTRSTQWTVRGFEGMGSWWVVVLDYLVNGGEVLGAKKEKRRPLGHSLSSYQLFRAALDFFSRQDWSQERVFLRTDPSANARFSANAYETNGTDAVFADLVSGVNFLSGVPLGSLEMLKYDAQMTLETLSNANCPAMINDPFDEVFLTDKRTLLSRFDVVISINLEDAKLSLPLDIIAEYGGPYNALLSSLNTTLRSGLGNRAKAIAILQPCPQLTPLDERYSVSENTVLLGIILDIEHAHRLVDYGPPAAAEDDNTKDPHSEERAKFRALWGSKAELRRFKDGRILESVVWEVSTADERAHIPYLVCQYLLKQHFSIGGKLPNAVQWTGDEWDELLKLNGSIVQLYQAAKVQTGFKAAMSAFDGLVKTLKSMDDELPLAILNVSPVSPLLRYTNVFSPVAVPPSSPLLASSSSVTLPACARYVPLVDIVIEFEKSGRWPDDLKAIQKVKMAFLEAIAAGLGKKVNGLHAQIVLDDGDAESIRDTARLEILTPEGWAFSARICHDREATLLDDIIDDKPHIPKAIKKRLEKNATPQEIQLRHEAIQAKEVYIRRYIHGPRHHRAVAALSHRFSAYTGTVRLVKRWLASHWLLGGHIQEEVVELLCAIVFLTGSGAAKSEGEKEKASVPSTKERAFALVVQFLAKWEWEGGLFVPIYGSEVDGGSSAAPEVRSASTSRRGAWTIRTERDAEGYIWTVNGPDAVVARRIKDIARATWNSLQVIDGTDAGVKNLFLHPTTHYEVLVGIDRAHAPRYFQSVVVDENVWQKGKYANAISKDHDTELPLMPGFDPTQLLFTDLQRVYDETFKIFYDPYGGTTFGIIFDPTLKAPRPFRVRGGYNSAPLAKEDDKAKEKDKTLVALNVEAILKEIQRMGEGLITNITLQE